MSYRIDAEDYASPKLVTVARSFVLLGANILRTAGYLGLQSKELEKVIGVLMMVGSIARAVAAAKFLLSTMSQMAAGTEVAHAVSIGGTQMVMTAYLGSAAADIGAKTGQIGANTALSLSNLGLAATFKILLASMGPVGWALAALGAIGLFAAGYAVAGGFGKGAAGPAGVKGVGLGAGGIYKEPGVNITVNVGEMSVKKHVKEVIEDAGSLWYDEMRKRRT